MAGDVPGLLSVTGEQLCGSEEAWPSQGQFSEQPRCLSACQDNISSSILSNSFTSYCRLSSKAGTRKDATEDSARSVSPFCSFLHQHQSRTCCGAVNKISFSIGRSGTSEEEK